MTPGLRLIALFLIAAGGFGTGCNHEVGGIGDACDPGACAHGLSCVAHACVVPPSNDDGGTQLGPQTDGSIADGAVHPHDGGGDGGSCGACNTPPAGGCYGLVGTCEAGACVYPIVSGASCDDGNPCTVDDTCSSSGQCMGSPMVCNTPPGEACVTSSTLRTYDASGSCESGLCVYTSHDTSCGSSTCTNNTCAVNLCASITCNTPPSACYSATGTCDNGSCSYGYADGTTCDDGNACTVSDSCVTGVCQGVPMACNTPPASVCKDASTAQIYSAQGSCAAGTCSYTYGYQTCAAGCANGVCNDSGWKLMISSTTAQLNAVWGSSASAVWAGGYEDTMLFYNGIQWEVRPTGLSDFSYIQAIHGTAANNVFALTSSSILIRFDGTSWSTITSSLPTYYSAVAIFALGTNDVLISGESGVDNSSGENSLGVYTLTRVTNGVVSQITSWEPGEFDSSDTPSTMWAFSASDVYLPGFPVYHWNGTAATQVGGDQGAYHIWAASQSAIFSDATGASELESGSWFALDPSTSPDNIYGLTGSAANRVFVVGGNGDTGNSGFVDLYDGTGWTRATVPATTGTLYGVWAATTGQVYAVGANGSILEGP